MTIYNIILQCECERLARQTNQTVRNKEKKNIKIQTNGSKTAYFFTFQQYFLETNKLTSERLRVRS